MDVESVLNKGISATDSFQLYGPKAVSLTFALWMISFGRWMADWFRYYYATSTGWLFHLQVYPVATRSCEDLVQ